MRCLSCQRRLRSRIYSNPLAAFLVEDKPSNCGQRLRRICSQAKLGPLKREPALAEGHLHWRSDEGNLATLIHRSQNCYVLSLPLKRMQRRFKSQYLATFVGSYSVCPN